MDDKKIFSVLLVAIVVSSIFTAFIPCASAGTFSNGKFDLTVCLKWKATAAELNNLKNTFQEFSEQLYDSTDGTHQLGKVVVFNCNCTRDDADIYITKTNTRLTSRAHILGIFSDSKHMYMDTLDTRYVYVHEFGHYGYGLYDEYFGRRWNATSSKWERHDAECTDDGSGRASIMYSTAPTRDEFCTPSNHDADKDTEQERRHGVSCWEYMRNGESDWKFWAFQGYSDLVIPAGDADPGPTSGADTINWVVKTCEKPNMVLLIDRSGSMSGQKISDAKSAAKLFVNLMRINDSVGACSFASSSSVNYPLTKITSETQKTAAKNAINAISASGMTAMGDGLRTAYNQLSSLDYYTPKTIILLSNGWHNWGTEHPTSIIPDLKSKNIKVYTIGLGSGAQESLLRQIASETGGTYSFAPSSADLQRIYDRIAAETTGVRAAGSEPGSIAQGEIKTEEVTIDSSISQATFILTWGGSDLDLSLESPDGSIINKTVALTYPTITFYEGDTYELYRIDTPLNGIWKMIIEGVSVTGTEEYLARATGESRISLLATLPVQSQFPVPIHIFPTLQGEYPIMKADVTATIVKDSKTIGTVPLHDDGDIITHGDSMPDDGTYSNLFTVFDEEGEFITEPNYFNIFSEEGTYTIELKAVNDGSAIMGILEGEEGEPFYINLTEPFTREFTVLTSILGVGLVDTSTGSGTAYFGSYNGIFGGTLIAVDEATLPSEGKPEVTFPHGLFSFALSGLSSGQTVNITLFLPDDLPTNTEYWKYGPTPDNSTPHWYQIPIISNDGDNVIMIQLTDGGIGDDDLAANGVIVDQGGPGISDPWADINAELDALIAKVNAAVITPDPIKTRLLNNLKRAKAFKERAKEAHEADNNEQAKKYLRKSKDQVESFSDRVKITDGISQTDKDEFLKEEAKIIGKIDNLIEKL